MPIDKKNIFLSGTIEPLPFTSRGAPGSERAIPPRNPAQHVNYLKGRFEEAYAQNKNLTQQQVAAIRYKEGLFIP